MDSQDFHHNRQLKLTAIDALLLINPFIADNEGNAGNEVAPNRRNNQIAIQSGNDWNLLIPLCLK